MRAYPQATPVAWEDFLRQLDTAMPPIVVVSDEAPAVKRAVRVVWPQTPSPSLPMPFVVSCQWHLRSRLRIAMDADRIGGPGSFHGLLAQAAFTDLERWEAFTEAMTGFAHTQAWLRGHPEVAGEVAVGHLLPGPRTTGALDTAPNRVRAYIENRSFVLRNARRTNLMLGLVRLHLNGTADPRNYRRLLREAIGSAEGEAPAQRAGADRAG